MTLQELNPAETVLSEITRFQGEWITKEIKGGYPKNIAHFPEIDIESLTAGDDDPQFLILPVAEADVISANGVFYSSDFVAEIERQMIAKRPTGNQGHIKDEDRASIFPTPAGYWVGATRSGNVLWGKSYLPPNHPMREIVQRLKAVGGTIATSIYGTGERVWDKLKGAFVAIPGKFNLESIDFAPAERAGVGSLARVPQLVSEMQSEEEIPMPDKAQIISELTVGEIPQPLKDAIVEAAPEVKLVAEMRQKLGLDDKADLGDLIAEMQAKLVKIEADAVEAAIIAEIKAVVMPDVKVETDGVKSTRAMIAKLVRAEHPTLATFKEIVQRVAATDESKSLYADVVTAAMGPALGRSVGRQGEQQATGMLKPKPVVK